VHTHCWNCKVPFDAPSQHHECVPCVLDPWRVPLPTYLESFKVDPMMRRFEFLLLPRGARNNGR